MWFKQLQVFNVSGSIPRNSEDLEAQLEKIAFERCKAHTPFTAGWVAPIDEEDGEDDHHHGRLQHGPGDAESGLLVADLDVAPGEEEQELAVRP